MWPKNKLIKKKKNKKLTQSNQNQLYLTLTPKYDPSATMYTQDSSNNKMHTHKKHSLNRDPSIYLLTHSQGHLQNAKCKSEMWQGTPLKNRSSSRLLAESSVTDKPLALEMGKPLPRDIGPCESVQGIPKSDARQKLVRQSRKRSWRPGSISGSAICWLCVSGESSKPL